MKTLQTRKVIWIVLISLILGAGQTLKAKNLIGLTCCNGSAEQLRSFDTTDGSTGVIGEIPGLHALAAAANAIDISANKMYQIGFTTGDPSTRLFIIDTNTGNLLDNLVIDTSDFFNVANLQVPNNPPVAQAQSVTTDEDTPILITLTGSDADGDVLSFAIISNPTNGTLSGAVPNLTYTPNLNFFGNDSFSFTANDGIETSSEATVAIAVNPVNDAPSVPNIVLGTPEDTPRSIPLSSSDVEGNPLTFSIVDGPDNGTLSGDGTNRTYTPNPNFNGTDSFTFQADDVMGSRRITRAVWEQ